jgi:hypothetical protein
MIKRFIAWCKSDSEIEIAIKSAIQRNAEFIFSLDERQRDYYLGLHDSWRKEMVRLEKRIYDLEERIQNRR